MKQKDEIEDSLEFCKDIQYYDTLEKSKECISNDYSNLNEYIQWLQQQDKVIHKEYETLETYVDTSVNVKTKKYRLPKDSISSVAASTLDEVTSQENPIKQSENSEKTVVKDALHLLVYIIIAVTIVLLLNRFVITHTKVSGSSMETTLHDGDYLFIDRISYRFQDPARFDLIVFEQSNNVYYIKRIIGVPGQTVQIKDGDIYIDQQLLEENYGNAPMTYAGIAKEPITLGDDEYFVLGDNRNESTDSRFQEVGLIKRETIIGKTVARVFPLDVIGKVN